ncbi:hypothetical protein [Paenibacillus polymyxa]|uniref:Uncharacterized protein n=1 Tax=Paenibacillus polymyxa TaxID=1406 RepID=A0AAP4A2N5_PAEPO|nr:hypothetical protein [Paenibacillus polymyxa]MDH2334148.1 hypothetical protein [Paenibacillus polymyxa]
MFKSYVNNEQFNLQILIVLSMIIIKKMINTYLLADSHKSNKN